jgi:hypothetical protein
LTEHAVPSRPSFEAGQVVCTSTEASATQPRSPHSQSPSTQSHVLQPSVAGQLVVEVQPGRGLHVLPPSPPPLLEPLLLEDPPSPPEPLVVLPPQADAKKNPATRVAAGNHRETVMAGLHSEPRATLRRPAFPQRERAESVSG